jgi:D-isomer specific 2-hydroxyacid dehydrogenase, catalytic domain
VPSVLFAYKPLLDYAERADDVRVQQAASTLDFAQLATSHPEAEALITLITHRIDSQVLTCRPALRVVANVAAGIDNIDVAAASRLGILICNVPGAVEETTADLTFGLIISACRQLTAAEQQLRTGRWTRWELDANLGMDVHDASLGLVGFGAGLDVFVGEPAVNPRLLGCPRITLLPHIGSATLATRRLEEMPPVGPRLASLDVRGRCQATRRPAGFASSAPAPSSSRSGCHQLRGSADQIKVQVGPSSGQPPPRIQSHAGDPLPKARPQQGDAPTVVARARTRNVACRLGSLSGSWSAPGRLTRRRPA